MEAVAQGSESEARSSGLTGTCRIADEGLLEDRVAARSERTGEYTCLAGAVMAAAIGVGSISGAGSDEEVVEAGDEGTDSSYSALLLSDDAST